MVSACNLAVGIRKVHVLSSVSCRFSSSSQNLTQCAASGRFIASSRFFDDDGGGVFVSVFQKFSA